MNDGTSGAISNTEEESDWRRLRNMADEEIHAALLADSDVQPTDDAFWEAARLVVPARKESVTVSVDADVLEWLRKEPSLETTVNAILRAYMGTHRR